jgi:hypothetical protein
MQRTAQALLSEVELAIVKLSTLVSMTHADGQQGSCSPNTTCRSGQP